ncbi:hypothetical protein GGI43DRAFT_122332 [Trichoderma evansii]
MPPTILEIDPAGDTLFILRNPNAPFAVDSSFEIWDTALPQYWTPDQQQDEENLKSSALVETPAAGSTPEIHMRLSSKHLTLSSIYFQRLTANDWKETKAESGYSYTVTAEEWDEEALIILMNIIHGQTQKVPLDVDLEKLAKIAVLVDYYKCHKAVDFFAKVWVSRLQSGPFLYYSRELLLRLFVSYVFSEYYHFTKLTRTIIYVSRGPIHTLGLPMPKELVDALDKSRQRLISGFASSLNTLKTQLSKEETECSFECLSLSLGVLVKGMRAMRLHDPQPTEPFDGYSVYAIENAIKNIKMPEYHRPIRHETGIFAMGNTTATATASSTKTGSGSGFFNFNLKLNCNLENKTKPIIHSQLAELRGLVLESFANWDPLLDN